MRREDETLEDYKQRLIQGYYGEGEKEKIVLDYAAEFCEDNSDIAQAELDEIIGSRALDGLEFTDTESAFHSKSIITDTANATLRVEDAFAELLDNIIQNYLDRKKKQEEGIDSLAICVELNLSGERPFIVLRENSGGISEEGRRSLAQYGMSAASSSDSSIGVWGWGTKLAFAALSRDVTIFTRENTEESGHIMKWDTYWWENDYDWNVKKKQLTPEETEDFGIDQGTTRIEFRELETRAKELSQANHLQDLIEYLGKIYSQFLSSGEITITFNTTEDGGDGNPVVPNFHFNEEDLCESFTFIPGFYPQIFSISFAGKDKKDNERRLLMKAFVGIWNENLPDRRGVMMWGNNRLFTPSPVREKFGRGNADTSWKKGWNMKGLMNMYVFFEADNPKDIPWMAPVKKGFSVDHFFGKAIIQTIRQLAEPWFKLSKILNQGLGDFNKAFTIHDLSSVQKESLEGSD